MRQENFPDCSYFQYHKRHTLFHTAIVTSYPAGIILVPTNTAAIPITVAVPMHEKKEILVSFVIVSHNHAPYLDTCLSSLRAHTTTIPSEILCVNNASTDKTPDIVMKHFPYVRLINRAQSFGFAKNCNLAVRSARGKYIFLLNPDTVVQAGSIRKLIRFMDSVPSAGICGPKLVNPDGTLQYSCRAFPTWKTVFVRRFIFRKFLKNTQINRKHLLMDLPHDKAMRVDWVLGAAMMIRKKVVNQIGPLDENFYLYGEDIDYCYRAKLHGWHTYYVPSAMITHHHLAESDKSFFNKYSQHHLKSMIHYWRKHGLRQRLLLSSRPIL